MFWIGLETQPEVRTVNLTFYEAMVNPNTLVKGHDSPSSLIPGRVRSGPIIFHKGRPRREEQNAPCKMQLAIFSMSRVDERYAVDNLERLVTFLTRRGEVMQ